MFCYHMSVESVLSLDRLKSAWKYDPQDRIYVVVLVGLVLSMLGFYYLTLQADDYETVMMPQLTIYATTIILVAAIVDAFFDIGKVIVPEEEDEGDDLFDTETELSFNLSYLMLIRKTAAIVLYFLGVFYVGFYTISTVFTFVYVFLNTDEEGLKRVIRATFVAGFVLSLLWIIFDYFLGMIQIYRLGPLP